MSVIRFPVRACVRACTPVNVGAIQVHDQEVHQPDGKKEDVAKDAIVHPAHVAAPANQVADSQSHPVIAVLVLGCNRGDALKRSITQVLK